MYLFRRAIAADAEALAQLAETSFRDTFAAMNTVSDMALHCAKHYGVSIQRNEILDTEIATFVCEFHGKLIAYAQLRWRDPPSCVIAKSPVEIQRLYVDKTWHGKGLAPELMSHCLAFATTRGSDKVWLGVWEKNPRAIAFYKKLNFTEVGAHVFPLGRDPQRDIIMQRAV